MALPISSTKVDELAEKAKQRLSHHVSSNQDEAIRMVLELDIECHTLPSGAREKVMHAIGLALSGMIGESVIVGAAL